MTARLRPASATDYPAVAALLERLALPLAGVPKDLDGYVVAENDGGLTGAAGLESYGCVGLLRSVAVDPDFRNAGVGATLVERLLEAARGRGMTDVYLLTTTAERYFPRFGFSAVPRELAPVALQASAELRGACPDSAVLMHRRLPRPTRVLVLCTGNSARSQMAEALLARKGGSRLEVVSAGVRPAPAVHPLAVATLRLNGVDWANRSPRGLDTVANQTWDVVITVCDQAREACPVLPGGPSRIHWSLSDPAQTTGSDAEREQAFRDTYDLLDRLTDRFLAEVPPSSPEPAAPHR